MPRNEEVPQEELFSFSNLYNTLLCPSLVLSTVDTREASLGGSL